MSTQENRDRLLHALEHGIEGVAFLMRVWNESLDPDDIDDLSVIQITNCGTAACIGGHLELLEGYRLDQWAAGEHLGVEPRDWDRLCYGDRGICWDHDRDLNSITKHEALSALRRLFDAYPLS